MKELTTHGLQLHDKAGLQGFIKIELRYADGHTVDHFEGTDIAPGDSKPKENLIMLLSRQNMLRTIYDVVTSDPIKTLKYGTGGAIDPQGLFPIQVTKTLTNLFQPVGSVATTYSLDNSYPYVTFIADIPETSSVGLLINEVGLFTLAGNMFNIKTFPAIPKTSEFSVHIEWTITLS
jgi:hypothetical protein